MRSPRTLQDRFPELGRRRPGPGLPPPRVDPRNLPPVTRWLATGEKIWITYGRRPARPGEVIQDAGDDVVIVRYADQAHPVSRARLRLREASL